mmetsp:Transcript_5138/g.3825  ORF Transcript_5138/g.3825 Transcript_5138/m.3825 type:complete len:80 (-) Transcript_5138:546-785(-)
MNAQGANSSERPMKKEETLLKNAQIFVYKALSYFPASLQTLYSFPNFAEMIRIALVDLDHQESKLIMQSAIKDICFKLE